MTEQEIREIVRRVIAQREAVASGSADPAGPSWSPVSGGSVHQHVSHALFVIPAQGEACVIEPGVACNHCGYCKSYGH